MNGIASKVDRKVLLDKEGLIVEDREDPFGLPTQYQLQRPDKLIFVDEVGSNTSTTKDGHLGGVRNSSVKHMGAHRSKRQQKTHILQSWVLPRRQENLSCVP